MKQPSSLRLLFSAAVFGLLALGARADAAFIMTIDTKMIEDNMDGDADDRIGVIHFSGMVSGFDVVLTGFSKPIIGGVDSAHIDILVGILSENGGTIMIKLKDTDFELPPGAKTLTQLIGGTTMDPTAAVDFISTVDIGPTTVSEVSDTVLGAGAFSANSTAFFAYAGGAFTILSTVEVTLGASELISFNAETEVSSPEPATFAYLGLSLGALALRRRRRVA